MAEMVRERSDGLREFEIPFPDHRRAGEDGVPRTRPRVDSHDDLLDGRSGSDGVLDRSPERPSVDPFGDREHVRMRDEVDLLRRGEDDRYAVRNPVTGEKAHRRPASLPQETREFVVERGVPSDECDRPVSQQRT